MEIVLSSTNSDLQFYFSSLLKSQVQTFRKKDFSLLEAAGYPDYENVISNLYTFFLNEREYDIGKLFMASLRDCLSQKGLDIQIDSWTAHREVVTETGRIDLVIEEDCDKPEKVIIIENKLYHDLHNDLKGYYDHYSEVSHRMGVVLSLRPISETPYPFVNITHLDWVKSIKARIGEALPRIPIKHLVLLQDFITHIESYHERPVTMESYKFLFENAEKIAAINNLAEKAIDQIKKDIYESIGPKWEQYRSSATSIALKRKEIGMVLYLTTDGIFKAGEHHFIIQLWLKGKSIVDSWEGKAIPNNSNGIEPFNKRSGNDWILIAAKQYELESKDFTDFKTMVSNLLSSEWETLIEQVKQLLATPK